MKNLRKLLALTSSACLAAAAFTVVASYAAEDNSETSGAYLAGDANCDGKITAADAVAILQHLGNRDRYSLTEQGMINGDVDGVPGITPLDALEVQKYDADVITKFVVNGESAQTTTTTSGESVQTTTTTSGESVQTTTTSEKSVQTTTAESTQSPEQTTTTAKDDNDTKKTKTYIHFNEDSITVEGENATVNGTVVTIDKEGTYCIDGTLKNGQIVVDVDKELYPDSVVELELSDVNISNDKTAPVYVKQVGDEVQITAKKGTSNVISDGTEHTETYTDSDGEENVVEGAIFSKDDIKFKGTGSLTINGNTDDAVVCKNDIKIFNGTITVNAVDDGIRGKDSVVIGNDDEGTDYSKLKLTVNTKQGDGIKATSTQTKEGKSYGVVTINGGTVNIDSYADGIQAEQEFVMNGGDVNISTYEGSNFGSSGSSGDFNFGNFGSGSSNQGGGSNRPGGSGNSGFPGGMQDGNSNKTDISAKGIKAVGLYDEAGTTWQSKGDITINGGTLTIDSSDDCIHCGGDMKLLGGTYTLSSADDGVHSDHDVTVGQGKPDSYDDVQISVLKAYEGIEGVNITQNSGTVIVTSTDDGFNAAGGADGSGNTNPFGGWNQGGWGNNSGSSASTYCMTFNGGLALVNVQDGDHDGYDSNGDIKLNGGIQITNGNEPFDCGDRGNSITVNGSTWVSNCGSGGMMMGQELSASVTASQSVSAGTRISLVGKDGKVIVSFLTGKSVSTFKAGGENTNGASFKIGGTVSGGTELKNTDGSQVVYIGGTYSEK